MADRLARTRLALARSYRQARALSVNWLTDHVSPGIGRHNRPGQVVCLLTERCSSKCVHCDIWRNRGLEDGATFEEWSRLMTEIRAWLGPTDVVLTGGEALLKPFAIELAEYASQIGHRVELLSHGYWKHQEMFERVALAGLHRITISLDGIGTLHDQVRGRAGFLIALAARWRHLSGCARRNGLTSRFS